MGGVGFGVRVMFRVIISVQSIVFWALFEISVLTLEPQVGHSKFPDFITLILDNNLFVRYNCSIGVSQPWWCNQLPFFLYWVCHVQGCEPKIENDYVGFSVSYQNVSRFRSVFKKKPKKTETETEHLLVGFSVGFSPKPAKWSTFRRARCPFVGIMWIHHRMVWSDLPTVPASAARDGTGRYTYL